MQFRVEDISIRRGLLEIQTRIAYKSIMSQRRSPASYEFPGPFSNLRQEAGILVVLLVKFVNDVAVKEFRHLCPRKETMNGLLSGILFL